MASTLLVSRNFHSRCSKHWTGEMDLSDLSRNPLPNFETLKIFIQHTTGNDSFHSSPLKCCNGKRWYCLAPLANLASTSCMKWCDRLGARQLSLNDCWKQFQSCTECLGNLCVIWRSVVFLRWHHVWRTWANSLNVSYSGGYSLRGTS